MVSTGGSIVLDGHPQPYDKIVQFDGWSTLDLGFSNPEWPGGHMRTFAISPRPYREQHGTQASVTIGIDGPWTVFVIRDDWSRQHSVALRTAMFEAEIDRARMTAQEEGLLSRAESEQ